MDVPCFTGGPVTYKGDGVIQILSRYVHTDSTGVITCWQNISTTREIDVNAHNAKALGAELLVHQIV